MQQKGLILITQTHKSLLQVFSSLSLYSAPYNSCFKYACIVHVCLLLSRVDNQVPEVKNQEFCFAMNGRGIHDKQLTGFYKLYLASRTLSFLSPGMHALTWMRKQSHLCMSNQTFCGNTVVKKTPPPKQDSEFSFRQEIFITLPLQCQQCYLLPVFWGNSEVFCHQL